MEHSTRGEEWVPGTFDELEEGDPLETRELWIMARIYSRLRHRTSPSRDPEKRQQFEDLKLRCLRRAIALEPTLFLTLPDPGFPHLLIIYHHAERTFLHVPLAVWNEEHEERRSESQKKEVCAV